MKIVQDFMALLIYQMSIRSETKSLSSGQQFPKLIERSRADNSHASNRNRAKFELSLILWLSPLSASLMRTDKKVAIARTTFPLYMSIGPFGCRGNQSSDQNCPTNPNTANPLPKLWYLRKLIQIGQLALETFLFESVDGRTDARTDDGVLLYYKLT